MRMWRGRDEIPADWGRCVAAIGVFDGIHRGHRRLIDTAVAAAGARGLPVVVVTFDPHPLAVTRPGTEPARLSTLTHRAELAAQAGADALLVIEFTEDFARLTGEQFVTDLLVAQLHVDEVIVGENFTFGHRAAGDAATLTGLGERYGFAVRAVGLVEDGEATVSSTHIRERLAAGDVAAAAAALGRAHRVEGTVVRGFQRGRELGFPTANLDVPAGTAIPADGVYAAWLRLLVPSTEAPDGTGGPGRLDPDRIYQAAVSVGTNPTFDGAERTVEAHVLDVAADMYGARVAVDFVARLRGMDRFDGIEELIAAMDRDVARTREILGPPADPPAGH